MKYSDPLNMAKRLNKPAIYWRVKVILKKSFENSQQHPTTLINNNTYFKVIAIPIAITTSIRRESTNMITIMYFKENLSSIKKFITKLQWVTKYFKKEKHLSELMKKVKMYSKNNRFFVFIFHRLICFLIKPWIIGLYQLRGRLIKFYQDTFFYTWIIFFFEIFNQTERLSFL